MNHNRLLADCEGVNGGKTGYTKAAGRSLVTSAERDGLRLICVTLGCPDDWKEHTDLYNWAYGTYSCVPLHSGQVLASVPVVSGTQSAVEISAAEGCALLLEKNAPAALDLQLSPFVFAPVAAGERAGKAVLRSGDTVLGEVELVYRADVSLNAAMALSPWQRFWRTLSLAGYSGGIYDLRKQ